MTATVTKRKQAKESRWRGYIKRWRDLQEQRSKLDYETAKLSSEIRSEFSDGAGGDLQFRIWCVRNLDICSSTAAMLLRSVRVYKMFEERDWHDFGGWQSLQFLSNLKGQGRRKVLNACRAKVAELRSKNATRRTIGYTTVRRVCYECGVQANYRTGRPNRLRVEEDLGFCRNWIKTLYQQYENLPKPPKAVEEALGGTKLSAISEAMRDAG